MHYSHLFLILLFLIQWKCLCKAIWCRELTSGPSRTLLFRRISVNNPFGSCGRASQRGAARGGGVCDGFCRMEQISSPLKQRCPQELCRRPPRPMAAGWTWPGARGGQSCCCWEIFRARLHIPDPRACATTDELPRGGCSLHVPGAGAGIGAAGAMSWDGKGWSVTTSVSAISFLHMQTFQQRLGLVKFKSCLLENNRGMLIMRFGPVELRVLLFLSLPTKLRLALLLFFVSNTSLARMSPHSGALLWADLQHGCANKVSVSRLSF